MCSPKIFRTQEAAEAHFGRSLNWAREDRKVTPNGRFESTVHHNGRYLALEGRLGVCVAHVYDTPEDFIRNAGLDDILRD